MKAWVNRSAEVRRQEVEKRNGYITRPMNSFMLYRSAFAERTKEWCLQNNHQIVSSVSGESWPMEPPEVREMYNELAKIERLNHQAAHPDYKFSPSKAATPSKK
ncbi:high mobility group box domain-containing protein, partial [Lineolata rhizophorae]